MSAAARQGRGTWKPTISRSLQIMAVVVLLVIVSVTGQQMLQIRRNMINDNLRQMAQLDMVFAEQTGRAVETVDLIMRNAIDALHTAQGNGTLTPETMNAMLIRRIVGVRQVSEVAIADPAGHVLYSSNLGAGQTPANPELPAAGRTLLAYYAAHPDDSLQISEPIRGDNGAWSTLMARRIVNPDGSSFGIAVAYLNMLYFEDFYKAVELTDNGAIVLHRRDGTVLARYPHAESAIGTSFADLPPFKDVLAHDIAGTLLMTSPVDGSVRILAIRALRAFPLAVNVSVDEGRVLAGWRQQTEILLLAALVGCGIIVTLLLLLARESHRVEVLLGEFRGARDAAQSANTRLLVQMEERERAEVALRQAQRIEAVGQLTGGVAHDFNNLLTVLLGNIDLLKQTAHLDPAVVVRLDRMRAAAERGATLTDQLLAFARRQPLAPRAVELNALVQGMADLLQSAIGSNMLIERHLTADPWPALVDPTQIELVILNLAINARDAMPQGGTLTIETTNVRLDAPTRPEDPPAGDYVAIRVRDTGRGMTPDVLAKAVEPFFTTKEPGQGSGLGLSQVYGLARQSGGGVHIDSTPDQGTSVSVYLPRAAGRAEPHDPPAPDPFDAAGSASSILLVDDDEAVRSTTAMILQTMGYTVHEAASGHDALAMLTSNLAVDVLLTDVAMPGMNGPELARQARGVRPETPIVFFSGYADPEAVAGDTIRQRIVRKPFRAAELAAQIEAAMAEARASV